LAQPLPSFQVLFPFALVDCHFDFWQLFRSLSLTCQDYTTYDLQVALALRLVFSGSALLRFLLKNFIGALLFVLSTWFFVRFGSNTRHSLLLYTNGFFLQELVNIFSQVAWLYILAVATLLQPFFQVFLFLKLQLLFVFEHSERAEFVEVTCRKPVLAERSQ
jgi:hypothetical protein